MFRKLFIICILIFPILYAVFIGYPVSKTSKLSHSQRCYEVGNMQQFVSCFGNTKLSGQKLINTIVTEINSLQNGMGHLVIIFIALQILCIPFLINEIKKK